MKLKQADLAKYCDVNAVSHCTNKNKEKTEKLQSFDLSYYFGKDFLMKMVFKICLSINIYHVSVKRRRRY